MAYRTAVEKRPNNPPEPIERNFPDMVLLEVSHLRKSYGGTTAVDDLSFHLQAGEIFGLLGPNGAGKTTTMLMLTGLLEADAGSITIDGQAFDARQRDLKRSLGIVPQDLAMYPDLTAWENLSFFGGLYGLRGERLRNRIECVLDQIGLSQHAQQPAATFSGGMKRRLNFGIAIVHEPRLLILDEPTVGVDPQSRSHLLDCIRGLSQQGVGVLYASHYMEEVEALCDRVAILDGGRMIACGGVRELKNQLTSQICLRVSGDCDKVAERLGPGAELRTTRNGEALIVLTGTESSEASAWNTPLARILNVLDQYHVNVAGVEMRESNLERLFLELTGRSLRD